jgi:hypothetical protein
MRKIASVVPVVLALAVPVGSSCSGGGGVTGDASTRAGLCPSTPSANSCVDGCNPCTRLSDDQVAAVVGMSGVKGTWNGDVCEWDYFDAAGDVSFGIELGVNIDYATFQDLCHSGGGADGGITLTPVAGVGDDACIITTSVGALGSFELDFLKGCFGYSVTVAGPAGKSPPFPDAMAQAYEKALALDAVPNL